MQNLEPDYLFQTHNEREIQRFANQFIFFEELLNGANLNSWTDSLSHLMAPDHVDIILRKFGYDRNIYEIINPNIIPHKFNTQDLTLGFYREESESDYIYGICIGTKTLSNILHLKYYRKEKGSTSFNYKLIVNNNFKPHEVNTNKLILFGVLCVRHYLLNLVHNEHT